jgi:hypothetical protein
MNVRKKKDVTGQLWNAGKIKASSITHLFQDFTSGSQECLHSELEGHLLGDSDLDSDLEFGTRLS